MLNKQFLDINGLITYNDLIKQYINDAIDLHTDLPLAKGAANGALVQTGLSTADDKDYTAPEATAIGSLALGRGCKAYGEFSIALGKDCTTGADAEHASRDTTGGQFAGGKNNEAVYNNTFVWGMDSGAYGAGAVSFGYTNNAYGAVAFSAGNLNISNGTATVTLGANNRFHTVSNYSVMIGRNNSSSTQSEQNFMFGVANAITKQGNSEAMMLGNGNIIQSNSSGRYYYFLGRDNKVNAGNNLNTVILGQGNNIDASVTNVDIIGRRNQVSNTTEDTILIGVGNTVSDTAGGARSSYAVGINNTFNNNGNMKNSNGSVRNLYMSAFGHYNTIGSQAGMALGADNNVQHDRTQVLGQHLQSTANDQVILGKYNSTKSTDQFIIGGGTSEDNRGNILTASWSAYSPYVKIGDDLKLTAKSISTSDTLQVQGIDIYIGPDGVSPIIAYAENLKFQDSRLKWQYSQLPLTLYFGESIWEKFILNEDEDNREGTIEGWYFRDSNSDQGIYPELFYRSRDSLIGDVDILNGRPFIIQYKYIARYWNDSLSSEVESRHRGTTSPITLCERQWSNPNDYQDEYYGRYMKIQLGDQLITIETNYEEDNSIHFSTVRN